MPAEDSWSDVSDERENKVHSQEAPEASQLLLLAAVQISGQARQRWLQVLPTPAFCGAW